VGAHVEVIVALEVHHFLLIHVIQGVYLPTKTNSATMAVRDSSLRFLSRPEELIGVTDIGCDVALVIHGEARLTSMALGVELSHASDITLMSRIRRLV
jgi:hypothetical protein